MDEKREYWFESLWANLKGGISYDSAIFLATKHTNEAFEIGPKCKHGIFKQEPCSKCKAEQLSYTIDPFNLEEE